MTAMPYITVAATNRIAALVTAHMDESLRLIASQASVAFSSLCSILATQAVCCCKGVKHPYVAMSASLQRLQAQLLSQAPESKGRYALLTQLLPHVGEEQLVTSHPSIIREAVGALSTGACVAASTFLRQLLLALKQVCAAAVQDGSEALHRWRGYWVGPAVDALLAEDSRSISSVATYFVADVMKEDHASLPLLLSLVAPPSVAAAELGAAEWGFRAQKHCAASVAPVVALLRIARRLQLISCLDEATSGYGRGDGGVPESVLCLAAAHRDAVLRMDMLEVAALSNRTASVRRHALALHWMPRRAQRVDLHHI
jgi:hypothetical protein